MSDTSAKFWVVGSTHVDLAWKKDSHEHEEHVEAFIVRLLDILDHHSQFTYVLEQAYSYRKLARRRPDLIARLRDYIQQGRLEFVGGLASTLDTNGPSGESFVRNQLIGILWVEKTLGAEVQTGWLMDTFGINPQVPQLLRRFGINQLMANRFGGTLQNDVFIARGLDGSKIPVVGKDVYSPFVKCRNLFFAHCREHKAIDELFASATQAEGDGPCLVMPYTENEVPPSTRIAEHVDSRVGEAPLWRFCLPAQFFAALLATEDAWPEVSSDLNPEFTGTYGNRVGLRLHHRQAESKLVEAEMWATLLNLSGWRDQVMEAWWEMAFVQSHDVYTGSHPIRVLQETRARLADVCRVADNLIDQAVAKVPPLPSGGAIPVITALSGLPWQRDDIVTVTLPTGVDGVAGISDGATALPFEVDGRELRFRALFPGVSKREFTWQPTAVASAPRRREMPMVCIDQGPLSLIASPANGLCIRFTDPQGRTRNVQLDVTLQEDQGSFQIEHLVRNEVSAAAGSRRVYEPLRSSLSQRVCIAGEFPQVSWMRSRPPLQWELEVVAYPGKERVDITLRLDWHGEASRVRLKAVTDIGSSMGIYEVPFGTVERTPYRLRGTGRGEWPAYRWVAVEDKTGGVALINTGHMGVEVMGGTIWTTLLRSPKTVYAGMEPDDTSSQHGQHTYRFSLLPYFGTWANAGVLEAAQEVNLPVIARFGAVGEPRFAPTTLLTLAPHTVLLSAVKQPEDQATGELVVRCYESAGRSSAAELWIRNANTAWLSDLNEVKGEVVPVQDGRICLAFAPYEIKTLRVERL